VRSEMVALEREGYLEQPHTSAGRIPTDKGYRFFVDHLARPGILGPVQRQKVSRFFEHVHGEMEDMLERTSGLLSDLTSYAAVVVGPTHDPAVIRHIQLVGLGPRLGLLVVVLADGAVEKRTLEFAEDVPDELVAVASAVLQANTLGRSLADVADGRLGEPPGRSEPAPRAPTGKGWGSGDPTVERLVDVAAASLADLTAHADADQVFVGGPSRLAEAFDAVETVRAVLSILEQQIVVVSLLRDVLDQGLSVAIGTEHGYEPLASCALVVAPVSVEGRDAGAVGLVGPTRMDYPQALAAAHVVGERLGERIGDMGGRAPVGSAASRRGRAADGGRERPRARPARKDAPHAR